MKFIALLFLTALIFFVPPRAAEAQGKEIETVIQSQIEAFKRDDFAAAFEFASPSIQSMFGTSERFGTMVKQGYPMVWRPKDYAFLELRQISGALWQQVLVTDAQGVAHLLDYQMRMVDGVWRISAVQIIPAPKMSV